MPQVNEITQQFALNPEPLILHCNNGKVYRLHYMELLKIVDRIEFKKKKYKKHEYLIITGIKGEKDERTTKKVF